MKRTVTMNWNSQVEDDDDDDFYDPEADSDEEEFGDTQDEFVTFKPANNNNNNSSTMFGDFNSWSAEGDVKDRRKKLLQGMGLGSNKSFMKLASTKINRIVSKKVDFKPPTDSTESIHKSNEKTPPAESKSEPEPAAQAETKLVLSARLMLVRSRSDGDIDPFSSHTKKRKEEVLGSEPTQLLKRASSMILTPSIGICQFVRVEKARGETKSSELLSNDELGAFYLMKNLDTGGEFIVREGVWNKFTNLQTGKQLSLEEFEKTTGQSPVVKKLMNVNTSTNNDDAKKANANANNYINKTFKFSMKQGANLLKNIKAIVEGKEMLPPSAQNPNDSQWVRVRQQGKSYKELTGLHMCQEIQAHEGSIWTMKFSSDAKYLASAGEDKVIQIWEVQECDVQMAKPPDDSAAGSTAAVNPDRPPLPDGMPPTAEKKKKKASNKKKSTGVPDYVSVPETVFGLSEKPIYTLTGHTEDILDLSWSKTEQLLSSSMDKTVRLWNTETKECVKTFSHSDYVTCVQFNPINNDYFISGSLDSKFRIWHIPDRKVVDWTDVNEMVTAACFTPDAEGALVGSHKGNVRLFTTTDCKLEQKEIFEVRNKKKPPKKITGFEFAPSSSSEFLLSCADSRVRIMEGSNVIQKFAGLRNINSQIAASFTPNGKYVISASEDSHVYMWKRDEQKSGKPKSVSASTHAHEQFMCKDVSIAIPWPGCIKNVPPIIDINKKQSKKQGAPASESPTKEEDSTNSKKDLPPLPKNDSPKKSSSSPDDDQSQAPRSESEPDGTESIGSDGSSAKSPKSASDKPAESASDKSGESASAKTDDSESAKTGDSETAKTGASETAKTDDSESAKTNESPSHKSGESSSTKSEESSSNKSGESSSNKVSASTGSQSKSTGWSWFDAGGHGQTSEPRAWGLVIVTAGLGGEIRAYQNFGLPVKVKNQANIFIAPQK